MKKSVPDNYPNPQVVRFLRFLTRAISKTLWFIRYRNTENIPHGLEGGLLITPNHPTYFDPAWACAPMHRKFRFMVWDKAFGWFFIGRLIRYLGSFPVSYDIPGTKKAMKDALRSLKEGSTLIIFPEGEREFADGKMLEFKPGAVRIAALANVPILPVTIRGGNRIWPQDQKYPRFFRRVEVIYHPLFQVPHPPKGEDAREHFENLTKKLAEIIESEM